LGKEIRINQHYQEQDSGYGAFRSFVQKIKVLGDHAILTYIVPINGLMEEKIGVLPIV
jgi:hypothetical protein